MRFAVAEDEIDDAHTLFEKQMKDFVKKNKGKVNKWSYLCACIILYIFFEYQKLTNFIFIVIKKWYV